jgi:hypothetical protein
LNFNEGYIVHCTVASKSPIDLKIFKIKIENNQNWRKSHKLIVLAGSEGVSCYSHLSLHCTDGHISLRLIKNDRDVST